MKLLRKRTSPYLSILHRSEESWRPTALYNGMIAPRRLTPSKARSGIRGESNTDPRSAPLYARLLPALIADWRAQWKQGNFPFLFVQISNFNSPESDFGTVRDAQRRTLSVTNTAMAVTLDVGERDNIHPADKQTVGARLALATRAIVYSEPQLEFSGPLFRTATVEG